MERTVMKELLKWRDKKKRKPLILTGVRQCGKTYVLKQFGREYFEDVAYFNFEGNEELASIFEHNFDVNRILDELGSIVREKKIIPGKTLVIFDEIQASTRAITSLKYFCEDMPGLHIVAAGSLLGVALKREELSFPVGKIQRMTMYPMRFEEFVRADGGKQLLEGLSRIEKGKELPAIYTTRLEKFLKNYYIIGGMPEVVDTWIDLHDYGEAEKIQETILQDYENDFSKHAPIAEVPRIRQIWQSVPEQLAKENNKFIFSHVKKGARAKDLEDALEWLIDAGLIYKQKLVEKPELPLSFKADDTYFKVYMADVGLLRKKANVYYKTILDGDDNYVRFKGALTENFVLTELINYGFPYYFWRSENSAEVDFLIEYAGMMIPIEAKSADNTRAKSFHQFILRYHPEMGFKLSTKNVGDNRDGDTKVYSIPLYQIFRLKDYIE